MCEYETTEKVSLRVHIDSCSESSQDNDTRAPNLDCQNCSYRAIHTTDLKRHKSQMHSKTLLHEVYVCDKCGYSTQYEEKLRKHKQNHDTQQSRYFYRQKRTHQKPDVAVKTNGSTSDTPLNCSNCEFKTKSVGELREHKRKHAGKMGQKPEFSGPSRNQSQFSSSFACNQCESTFLHNDEHKLHMEYFHSSWKETNQQ